MAIKRVLFPAGVLNPSHTHPCGHGMYVLEGPLVTHRGVYGPGTFVWFPEGEVMEHGASPAGHVVVLFVTNKTFRMDYAGAPAEGGPGRWGRSALGRPDVAAAWIHIQQEAIANVH